MTSDTADVATPHADTAVIDGRRPSAGRGRKRDTERTQAILDAAGELLFEVGVDNFRVQDVATRACSGTGAIYRRWATKEALLAEAIRALPDPDLPTSGEPRDDLRETVSIKFAAVEEQPDLLPSMVAAMRHDEGIAAAVDDCYTINPIRAAVARVVGDDHPDLELLADLVPALALYRSTFGKQRERSGSLADDVMAIIDLVSA